MPYHLIRLSTSRGYNVTKYLHLLEGIACRNNPLGIALLTSSDGDGAKLFDTEDEALQFKKDNMKECRGCFPIKAINQLKKDIEKIK